MAVPPNVPDGLAFIINGTGNNRHVQLSWSDNSINETAFVVQRNNGSGWVDAGTVNTLLSAPNTHGTVSFTDPVSYNATSVYQYRVVAQNTIGYGGEFMSLTAQSVSQPLTIGSPPAAPVNLRATLQAGPQVRLVWTDVATNETGFIIERSTNGGAFVQIATAPARNNTGNVNYTDTTVSAGTSYNYRVAAINGGGLSAYSNTAGVTLGNLPGTPSIASANAARRGNNNERVTLTWNNVTGETGYTIQWSTNNFATVSGSGTVGANVTTYTTGNITRRVWQFRVGASNAAGTAWSTPVTVAAAP